MKPGSNPVEDHTQLNHNRYPVDGALVGAGSLWPPVSTSTAPIWENCADSVVTDCNWFHSKPMWR